MQINTQLPAAYKSTTPRTEFRSAINWRSSFHQSTSMTSPEGSSISANPEYRFSQSIDRADTCFKPKVKKMGIRAKEAAYELVFVTVCCWPDTAGD